MKLLWYALVAVPVLMRDTAPKRHLCDRKVGNSFTVRIGGCISDKCAFTNKRRFVVESGESVPQQFAGIKLPSGTYIITFASHWLPSSPVHATSNNVSTAFRPSHPVPTIFCCVAQSRRSLYILVTVFVITLGVLLGFAMRPLCESIPTPLRRSWSHVRKKPTSAQFQTRVFLLLKLARYHLH